VPPGARRLAAAALAAVAVLFAGRWLALFLADRWWGELLSPAAADFLTDIAVLRLVLDVAAVAIAGAWFTGHLLVVNRAISTVEVSRRVANLEVREALGPRPRLWGSVVLGFVLGLLAGGDAERHWREVALAWHGVRFGVTDPVLGHDAGTYVAQLPLWDRLLDFGWLLVVGALLVVLVLYAVIGALRWIDGRPAISDHARRHVGALLACVALLLALGFLVEPVRLVGGVGGPAGARRFQLTLLSAPVLAGVALSVALISAIWASRPRHALLVAGWLVFGVASFVARVIGAALVEPDDVPLAGQSRATFESLAYGLGGIRDSTITVGNAPGGEPPWPALWQVEAVVRAGDADSLRTIAADPAWIVAGGVRRPAWLVVGERGNRVLVRALADDRTSATGAPLYYTASDSQPGPAPVAITELSPRALHPGASAIQLAPDARGALAGGSVRRLFLAWALQDGRLLGALPPDTRVQWERTPSGRLRKLAPFADWSPAVPRLLDGRVAWVAEGYVHAEAFPLAERVSGSAGTVGYLRAGLVGLVDAESGAVRLFARPEAGPVVHAWGGLSRGLVEPWTAMPEALRGAVGYPAELFRVQSRLLQSQAAGVLVGSADSLRRTPNTFDYAWLDDAAAPVRVAAYERGAPPSVTALVIGAAEDGALRLHRLDVDPPASMPAPTSLVNAWDRFPTFERAVDSVRGGGGTLAQGGVRWWFGPAQFGAMQAHYGPRGGGGASVTWVSLAAHGRLGAGRGVAEAWDNLRGASAPLPPGYQPQSALTEARRWFQRADSALRAGDFTGFGRAFDALGATLEVTRPPPR
jgi:hypothetical protein